MLLAGDDQRIDDGSGVVDSDVAQLADEPGLDVHLDNRDVRAEGK